MFRTNQPSPFFPISSSCSYEVRSEVPPFLLHGTSTTTLPVILKEGLKRMSRQFVHMTEDPATATKTGIRLHVHVCVSLESVMLVSVSEVYSRRLQTCKGWSGCCNIADRCPANAHRWVCFSSRRQQCLADRARAFKVSFSIFRSSVEI